MTGKKRGGDEREGPAGESLPAEAGNVDETAAAGRAAPTVALENIRPGRTGVFPGERAELERIEDATGSKRGKHGMTGSPDPYPRYIEKEFTPFDPVALARRTEAIVCDGDRRTYTKFGCQGFYGGIATGYACGCCLRCVFCWVSWSRDFPERYGTFVSSEQAFRKLSHAARKKGYRQLRISGAEAVLGRAHLMGLLERVERSPFRTFILETNGILLGADPDLARELARFSKVHARVSLKAGTPREYTRKTGAVPESFDLPFMGIENLVKNGVGLHVAAMSADSRLVSADEREGLYDRLRSIHPVLLHHLEEEEVQPYPNALARLRHAGIDLSW